ncbi:ATP-binding protein [Streptomyces tendae]|uniref:ATP-binding protein n=1 Tax=Streptomyces tendae TaxID=1932 RepID=UPI003D71E680
MGAQTDAAYAERAGVPVTMAPERNNEAAEVKEWGWTQHPGCVPLSRKVFRKWLTKVNADHYEEDATLCFMELLTNAIRIPSPSGLTETKWLLYEDKLRIEVKDYSDEAPWASNPGPDSENGRGLILVHLLADKWGYDHCTFIGEDGFVPGKWVWFELHK